MDENRKKVILNEIQYWKESRMLPSHYCDYLLSLYSEGNPPQSKQSGNRVSRHRLMEAIFFVIAILATVVVIYFTELSFILQMGILVIIGFSAGFSFFYFFKKGILSHLSLVLFAFMALLSTVEAAVKLFPGRPIFLYCLMALNCLGWLLAGWKWRIYYFSVSGILGLCIIGFFIFSK